MRRKGPQTCMPLQVYATNRETDDLKLTNSQAKVRAFLGLYQANKEYSHVDLGDVLAQSFNFFRKIYNRNLEFYQFLVEELSLITYEKGEVVALLNEPAQTAVFILEGTANVYLKGGMSPERAKGYKQEYGEEFGLEVMNAASKRKSNLIQEENSVLDMLERRQKQHQKVFTSQQQIRQWFPQIFKVSKLSDLDSIDESALKRNVVRSATIICETPMTVVCLSKTSFKEKTFKYDNIVIQTDQKLDLIRSFGLFRAWDTKLNSLLMYFQKRKHKWGDLIYEEGDPPTGFYLILNGDVQLTTHTNRTVQNQQAPIDENKSPKADVLKVDVQLLSRGAYFGEIELLKRMPRQCTARCTSALVEVFSLSKKNFFLLGYQTDLFYILKQKLPLRQQHKEQQQSNALRMKSAAAPVKKVSTAKVDYSFLSTSTVARKSTKSKINNHKQPIQSKIRFFHGNEIQDTSGYRQTKVPQFSMLQSNKEMYKETVKKFRRFMNKTKDPYKPDLNWDMKRIWKVLNLDTVLEQESQLAHHKEGLQFFYKHQRLQNHISQVRSTRPRTSSCSYKDKIKYIRYLDSFGRALGRKTSRNQ